MRASTKTLVIVALAHVACDTLILHRVIIAVPTDSVDRRSSADQYCSNGPGDPIGVQPFSEGS
mgnify:CR=1 FL=1